MARKTRYIYDSETCTFKEEKLTPSTVFKRIATVAVCSLILAAGLAFAMREMVQNSETQHLKDRAASLEEDLRELNDRNQQLASAVNELHNRDRSLFRSMLGMEPVSEQVFEGGVGGAENPDAQGETDLVRKARQMLDDLEHKIERQNKSYDEVLATFSENEEMLQHIPIIKPVPGQIISGFGLRRHPILKFRKMHTGIDMQAASGTIVHATGDGVVRVASHSSGGYGIQIEIDHGYGYVTKYAHLRELMVKVGDRVSRGDPIAESGNTGTSSGPHLHYEVIQDGRKVNPVDHLIRSYTPQEFNEMKTKAAIENESMD